MKGIFIILTILTACINVTAQQNDDLNINQNYCGEYLGLNFPETILEVFAPAYISGKGRLQYLIKIQLV